MPHVFIAGNLGRDAAYKQTQGGNELCSFPVADEAGYGDNKQTVWFDVTSWGKGSKGLSELLRKGSKVSVVGELSTREHDGKTYLQVRADRVKIQSATGERGGGTPAADYGNGGGSSYDDLDDDVPFITSESLI